MQSALLIARATDFVAQRYAHQKRKGERAEPYVNHLVEVGRLLADATAGDDPTLVAAGLLHDTLEDVATTFEELEQEFGAEIARLVEEVTDDKRLPKAERTRLQIETAGGKSPRARLIKIADKTSNLRWMLANPPEDWSTRRKHDYFVWVGEVIAPCRGMNPQLDALFDRAYVEGMRAVVFRGGRKRP
jgi:(p)ppGpp synthase/HD superfamily hydrolase